MKRKNHSIGGYSLISMSLLIVVLGLFAAVGVGLSKQYGFTKKQDTSQEMIARVEEALTNYRALHGKLPCPARMDLGPTDNGFGVEDCTASSANTVASVPGSRNASARVKIGSVPVRSLNLPDNAILDGWNRRLVYAVTEHYTVAGVNFDEDAGQIKIVDAQDQDMTPNAPSSVIYAVLSPGADGRGAYSFDGRLVVSCQSGTEAFENCDMADAKFRSTAIRQYDTGATTYTSSMKYAAVEEAYTW
jgi:type II secretory pathway pseudopilin PulG